MKKVKEMKLCNQCGIVKPVSEFYRNGKYLRSNCKECQKALVSGNLPEDTPAYLSSSGEEAGWFFAEHFTKGVANCELCGKKDYLFRSTHPTKGTMFLCNDCTLMLAFEGDDG